MTSDSVTILLTTAASIALVHTLVGVDHYLPFIVMARARRWSLSYALAVTGLCGVGHVVGSVLLGAVGIGLGVAIDRLEWVESVRGSIAAWGLIAFGLCYATWAMVRRGRHHAHHGTQGGGLCDGQARLTPWALFVVFVLGPCEPLIPLLMAPAWQHAWHVVVLVTAVFALVTIVTMLAMVAVLAFGLESLNFGKFERHGDALAGLAIALSGAMIKFLGV